MLTLKALRVGVVTASVSLVSGGVLVTSVARSGDVTRVLRWPGGCELRASNVANPPATDAALWRSAAASLVGDPNAFWLIPGGCAWLSYPPKNAAQTASPAPGASSIPTLTFKIGGHIHRAPLPILPGALGLQGTPMFFYNFQTFTVAWPLVYFAACDYEGIQHTQSNSDQAIYGHYTDYIFNARGRSWDTVTDAQHPCE